MGYETISESPSARSDRGDSDLEAEQTDEIVERYEKLVYKIAHRLHENLPEQVELEDLVGWGYTGLLEAYQRYDEDKTTQFASFAYYRIRGAMLDACPKPLTDPHRRLVETGCNEVLNTFAHVVNSQDNQAGVDRRVSMLSDVAGSLMMVFVLSDCPEQALRPSRAPHDRKLTRRQTAERMRELLEELPENEREVLMGVYFEERSLTEIGERLDLSPSWISRVHSRALERLRKMIDGDGEFSEMRHAIEV